MIIWHYFICGKKENLIKHQKTSTYFENDCLQNFLLIIISLLAAPVVKKTHIESKIYLAFVKKHSKTNLKVYSYKIPTKVKRLEKQLSSKANFSRFLSLFKSNFRLNCLKGLRITKVVKEKAA